MHAQIDDEGNSCLLLDEIEDHRKDGTALTEQDAYVFLYCSLGQCWQSLLLATYIVRRQPC